MNYFMLSQGELQTIEAYKKIAETRNTTNVNPKFWEYPFILFKQLLPQGKVLDVGCGGGRDAQLFVPRGYGYVGIDISEEMLREAKKLVPEGNFLPMSMYFLDFEEAAFDGFWAAASLIHIPKCKIQLVLSQIKKVVKPGGIGLFIIEEGEGETMLPGPFPNTDRLFVKYGFDEFQKILEENHFEVIDTYHDLRECFQDKPHPRIWLLYFVKNA